MARDRFSVPATVAIPLAFLAVAALAAPAAAGLTHLSVGPHVGWSRTTESDESGPSFGLAARLKLLEFLAAELAVDHHQEDVEGGGEIKTIPIQLSGLLYVLPFLHGTIGVGWYNVDATLDAVGGRLGNIDDSATDAGLHLGGGLDIHLSPRLSLTGELRYVFLGYKLGEAADAVKVDADFSTISAGLQFFLW